MDTKIDLSISSAPTATCKKEKIRSWLEQEQYIPLKKDCLQVELIEVLNTFSPSPTYRLDGIAAGHGYRIPRTLPYHPELQIKTCWGIVKLDCTYL